MATSSKPKKSRQDGVKGRQQDIRQITNTCLTSVSALTHEKHIRYAHADQDVRMVYGSDVKTVKKKKYMAPLHAQVL